MRIVFDHQIFSCQRFGGISRSHCVQAAYLAALPGVDCRVVAPRHANHYLLDLPPEHVLGEFDQDAPPATGLLAANREASLPVLGELAPDVVHETYYTGLAPIPGDWRVVITVHDMTHERYPALCHPGDRTAEYKREAVARADLIVCPSTFTRDDLVDRLGAVEGKVVVVPNACLPLAPVQWGGMREGPFFLHVGNRSGFKNFAALLKGFALSGRLARELRLVCVGGGDFSPEERADIHRLGLDEVVVWTPARSDAALARLYADARGLVVPSLCEGFGMPVGEAMQAGCPVALPEAPAPPGWPVTQPSISIRHRPRPWPTPWSGWPLTTGCTDGSASVDCPVETGTCRSNACPPWWRPTKGCCEPLFT